MTIASQTTKEMNPTSALLIMIVTVVTVTMNCTPDHPKLCALNSLHDFFFCQGFLHRHWRFTGQQWKGGDHLLFHSTISTRSRTLRHLFATLHVRWLSSILIATLVFTRLLLDEIYHLIELLFEWLTDDAMFVCLLDELILGFCYSSFTLETSGFELASTTTLVLQANQLTKCTSHPIKCASYMIWLTINK